MSGCPASYAMLPVYFVPTPRQLVQRHDFPIDIIPWPRMRENIIRLGSQYDLEKVFSLLASTQRLSREFKTTNYVHRRDGGDFIIDERFETYIMHHGAWLLHEKFWKEYPELVNGLDANIMLKDGQLLPESKDVTGTLY